MTLRLSLTNRRARLQCFEKARVNDSRICLHLGDLVRYKVKATRCMREPWRAARIAQLSPASASEPTLGIFFSKDAKNFDNCILFPPALPSLRGDPMNDHTLSEPKEKTTNCPFFLDIFDHFAKSQFLLRCKLLSLKRASDFESIFTFLI